MMSVKQPMFTKHQVAQAPVAGGGIVLVIVELKT